MGIIINANDLLKTVRNGFWKYVYLIEINLFILICASQELCAGVLQPCSNVQKCVN